MSNLKSAPIHLTESVVAKLTGDRPSFGKGIVYVPFEGKVGTLDYRHKIDLNTVPSSMEQLAESWKRK